jgi:hypothetical protein
MRSSGRILSRRRPIASLAKPPEAPVTIVFIG